MPVPSPSTLGLVIQRRQRQEDLVRGGGVSPAPFSLHHGESTYLGPEGDAEDREVALFLIEQLQAYNAGTLCVP